jgi:hypothetical protein
MATTRAFFNVFNVAMTAICVTSAIAWFSGVEHGLRGGHPLRQAVGIQQAAMHGIVGGGLVAMWVQRQGR